jgi:adenylate cyclase
MPFERERKFLVKEELIPEPESSVRIIQAYLSTHPARTVRIRLAGNKAFLTVKGGMSGISRLEFEYPIPVEDARDLLRLAESAPVEKIRKEIHVEGKKWEIDFFEGANKGLILAEVELDTEDEEFILPDWADKEVTGDWRYHNSQLAIHPYLEW